MFKRRSHFPFWLEAIVIVLGRALYRVRSRGEEHVPGSGGAVVIANHLSYADVVVLQLACPRPLRYVGYEEAGSSWFFKVVFRLAGVIPISQRRPTEGMRRAIRALEAGELVRRELRRREQAREEVDERLDVPPDDLRIDGEGRRREVDRQLSTEPVDRVLDRVGLHPRATAAEHPPSDPRDPFFADRVERRPAAEGDHDRHERQRVGLLDEEHASTVQLHARSLLLRGLRRGAHWAASFVAPSAPSPPSSSGITRTIVRPSWVM